MISLLPLDVFGMQSDTITHDGILFKPLIDMEIVVPNFFVSKCAKIIEIKKNGKVTYLKHQEWYRGKKVHGVPEEVKEEALSWPGIMDLINLAVKNCMIDHIDDNPRNNNIDNLRYSNLRDNANHRKKWESLDK